MGLLSDFFVATSDEIGDLDIEQSPVIKFPTVQAARVDVVKLTMLRCIIEGTKFDDYLSTLDSLLVRGTDEGPWIIKVPDSVYDRLSNADLPGVRDLADQWSKTEEWRLDGGTAENLEPFISELSKLATTGKNQNRELFVWVSL